MTGGTSGTDSSSRTQDPPGPDGEPDLRTPATMTNPVRTYPWGSSTAIAALQGRAPTGRPEAELWMGAHPGAPSEVDLPGGRRSLLGVIGAHPGRTLGGAVLTRFGPRLPFLVKLLAAEDPLSLQAHPSAEQAVLGFRAEEAQGVPVDAPERRYRDPSAKPELLCALSPFTALCGFRDPAASARLLEYLGVERLRPAAALLASGDPTGQPTVVRRFLTWPRRERRGLVAEVTDGARRLAARDGEFSAEAPWLAGLGLRYPDDPGVLCALLLNLVELAPGEAVYVPPGVLHTYLRGFGVEVMACSDNVLRGGLTDKHVDTDEVLRILDFRTGPATVLQGEECNPGELAYATPAEEFRLSRLHIRPGTPVDLLSPGPQVLLCVEGQVTVQSGATCVVLGRGTSAFVAASAGRTTVRGDGQVFRTTVGPVTSAPTPRVPTAR